MLTRMPILVVLLLMAVPALAAPATRPAISVSVDPRRGSSNESSAAG